GYAEVTWGPIKQLMVAVWHVDAVTDLTPEHEALLRRLADRGADLIRARKFGRAGLVKIGNIWMGGLNVMGPLGWGGGKPLLPDAENFPPAAAPSPAAWAATLAELDGRVRALRELAARLDPARLDQIVPGKDYTVAVMLHGTAQHLAYHGGQVALLKKLM